MSHRDRPEPSASTRLGQGVAGLATVPVVLAALPLVIVSAVLVTGVVLVVRGLIDVRRSARLARAGDLGQPATTGVVTIVVGAVIIGAILALAVFVLMSLGSVLDN